MREQGVGIAMPKVCDQIFIASVVGPDGTSAVVTFVQCQYFPPPLAILDFAVGPLSAGWWSYDSGAGLTGVCRPRRPALTIFVQEERVVPAESA
jgi:hypothetical protein